MATSRQNSVVHLHPLSKDLERDRRIKEPAEKKRDVTKAKQRQQYEQQMCALSTDPARAKRIKEATVKRDAREKEKRKKKLLELKISKSSTNNGSVLKARQDRQKLLDSQRKTYLADPSKAERRRQAKVAKLKHAMDHHKEEFRPLPSCTIL